jgi:hypothetical protein
LPLFENSKTLTENFLAVSLTNFSIHLDCVNSESFPTATLDFNFTCIGRFVTIGLADFRFPSQSEPPCSFIDDIKLTRRP